MKMKWTFQKVSCSLLLTATMLVMYCLHSITKRNLTVDAFQGSDYVHDMSSSHLRRRLAGLKTAGYLSSRSESIPGYKAQYRSPYVVPGSPHPSSLDHDNPGRHHGMREEGDIQHGGKFITRIINLFSQRTDGHFGRFSEHGRRSRHTFLLKHLEVQHQPVEPKKRNLRSGDFVRENNLQECAETIQENPPVTRLRSRDSSQHVNIPPPSTVGWEGRLNSTKPARQRLPQAVIIGVKKCGTRALLEYLRIHPDVRAPGPEPHFFDRYYHLGLDWYRKKMPLSIEGQVTIEKTPRYFVTKEAPERLHKMSRDLRLIVIVRDPVTRAISDFTQAASKDTSVNVTFRSKAFCKNDTEINTNWLSITTGLYSEHLRRWLNYFPLQNMLFVCGEGLISNPAVEMDKVQDFLGITRFIQDKHFYFNKTKGFPCLKNIKGSRETKCFNRSKGRHHPHVDETTLNRLREFYHPFNNEFYKLTGRNFRW